MQPRTAEREGGQFLSRLTTRARLVGAISLVLGCTLLPRHVSLLYLAPLVLLAGLWLVSGMPVRHAARRMLLAQFFILGIGALSLFSPSAAPVFFSAFLKSNFCVFTLVLLTWATPFTEILLELRRWRVPTVMLTTLALMYRYIPVLAGEARRMQRARESRTFLTRRRLAWHNLTQITALLFIRSADRAERIYHAMCARGWK